MIGDLTVAVEGVLLRFGGVAGDVLLSGEAVSNAGDTRRCSVSVPGVVPEGFECRRRSECASAAGSLMDCGCFGGDEVLAAAVFGAWWLPCWELLLVLVCSLLAAVRWGIFCSFWEGPGVAI